MGYVLDLIVDLYWVYWVFCWVLPSDPGPMSLVIAHCRLVTASFFYGQWASDRHTLKLIHRHWRVDRGLELRSSSLVPFSDPSDPKVISGPRGLSQLGILDRRSRAQPRSVPTSRQCVYYGLRHFHGLACPQAHNNQ